MKDRKYQSESRLQGPNPEDRACRSQKPEWMNDSAKNSQGVWREEGVYPRYTGGVSPKDDHGRTWA